MVEGITGPFALEILRVWNDRKMDVSIVGAKNMEFKTRMVVAAELQKVR